MKELDPRLIQKSMQLRNSSFFHDISTEVLVEIARLGEELLLESGEVLFTEGDPADGLYFLMVGELDVLMGKKVVNKVSEGEVIGEIALLDSGLRSASIRARGNATLLRFSQGLFDEVMEEYPQVAKQVLRTLVERIRGLTTYIAEKETM
ncbi:cyclic nucleotide-binding domain-containing protein [Myxococcota bacterium]|nr:cyclic nucleotide-binding domain-containing protein [Myxococcota bacterium]MBU1535987.1 cyclic nucleotide-binding domain-containing protein [Myxococcota bacterium]